MVMSSGRPAVIRLSMASRIISATGAVGRTLSMSSSTRPRQPRTIESACERSVLPKPPSSIATRSEAEVQRSAYPLQVTPEDMAALDAAMTPNTTVLVKGSRFMKMERAVQHLVGTTSEGTH